jgi:ectoine hydroxylase-related dioxygenase (phytanoyl-CoA dioxygenase family)
MLAEFEKNGYIIFNINDDELIQEVNSDVDKIINDQNFKTNSKIYSYNDAPRIVESYKHSLACARLAKYPAVIDMLTKLYSATPLPFSTINFIRSTQQPLHSDYVHFGTVPELLLAGSWIALEDIHPDSGPLQVVPGSHKLEIFEYAKLLGGAPKALSEIKKQYSIYENWVKKYIEDNHIKPVTPVMKAGDCIIWAANLLHGSPDCLDNSLSRKSQVTHWSFEGVEIHYNPNFSIPSKKNYASREVTFF